MVKIFNSDTLFNLKEAISIQQGVDTITPEAKPDFQPSIETNPRLLRIADLIISATSSATGNLVVYTTPTGKQWFYLTGMSVCLIKDATCNQATGAIHVNASVLGTKNLLSLATITLTAQQYAKEVIYSIPLRLDKGTQVAFNVSYTLGVMQRVINLYGYLSESNAG